MNIWDELSAVGKADSEYLSNLIKKARAENESLKALAKLGRWALDQAVSLEKSKFSIDDANAIDAKATKIGLGYMEDMGTYEVFIESDSANVLSSGSEYLTRQGAGGGPPGSYGTGGPPIGPHGNVGWIGKAPLFEQTPKAELDRLYEENTNLRWELYHAKAADEAAGDSIDVILYEDINSTRFIFSDDAHASNGGPSETDKILATWKLKIDPTI